MNYTTAYQSPLGELTLVSDGTALIGLWMVGQKYYAAGIQCAAAANNVAGANGAAAANKESGANAAPDASRKADTNEDAKACRPELLLAAAWLDAYFAGERPAAGELPLRPCGSDFRQMVWEILRSIPYGQTLTYGAIAQKLSAKTGTVRMAAQAVGGAVGHNPLSIIIPCHRVLGAGGTLTGYAGGVDKKLWLLKHEGAL